MEEERRKIYTVVAIVGLVAVLFSCAAGAFAGGVAGFLIGREQGEVAAQRVLEEGLGAMPFHMEEPMPWPEDPSMPRPMPERPTQVAGALVVEVMAGTPADRAGLQVRDVITAIDRTPIDAQHALADVLRQYRPGDLITVHFVRGDAEQSVQLELAAHPNNAQQPYLGVLHQMRTSPRFGAPND